MKKNTHLLGLILITLVSGCTKMQQADKLTAPRIFEQAVEIGRVESKSLSESSGLVVSRCNEDVLWSHNDSGEEAVLYAFGSSGRNLGEFVISNAENIDWEDIASLSTTDGCDIYIADIGNNYSLRTEFAIYVVREPEIGAMPSKGRQLEARKITFTYDLPDSALQPDAETLLIHPERGDIYIVTKVKSGPAEVFRILSDSLKESGTKAVKIAEITIPSIPPGLVTGGDISPDGMRMVLVDYLGAYEFTLSKSSNDFEEIFSTSPVLIKLGKRKQGEAISYTQDGTALFATSEGVNSPILRSSVKQ